MKLLFICSLALNVLFLVFALILLPESTKYAPNYSETGFGSIACGMSGRDIYEIIGPPLKVKLISPTGENIEVPSGALSLAEIEELPRTSGTSEVWVYTEQGRSTANYQIRNIVLDADGKLYSTTSLFHVD